MSSVQKVLLNSALSVLSLFILSKLLGKKQIAQLDFNDYVIGISIGSIAAEWSTDAKTPMYHYLIGMGIFFLFSIIISFLERKTAILKKIFKGKPIILIADGKIDYKMLVKSGLDINDVLGLARNKGYFDIQNISYAIFETNGEISFLPKNAERPTVLKDLDKTEQDSGLTGYVILDGKIKKEALNIIKKDEDWVKKQLKNDKIMQKNIILAVFDNNTQKLNYHLKKEKSV